MKVIKQNGKKEDFDINKIEATYKRINHGLNTKCPFSKLKENIMTYIVDDIKTIDITRMIIKSAVDLTSISEPDWQYVAGRFNILNLYKKASKNTGYEEADLYSPEYMLELIKDYDEKGLYNKKILETYSEGDIEDIANHIDEKRDFTYNYLTTSMYAGRYLLNPNGVVRELPQHLYMVMALFLAIPEKPENRLKFAYEVYEATSKGEISMPTPTLLNARTPHSQLSSCFEIAVGDDLREIFHSYENMAQISKWGGGIGVYLGNIRAKGSQIRGRKGMAGGVMPWNKIVNDTAIAVNQLGARAGAISVTLDVFHMDIFSFLDMQTETGDIRGKAFDLFPSVSFPDLFMKRVEADLDWNLFCPYEVEKVTGERMQDKFGEEFERFYEICEQDDRLEVRNTVKAKDLFKRYLKAVVETGMPYGFFRDTCNRLNPNKHAGHIYHTNLCTEIQQNTKPSEFIEETLEDGQVIIKYNPGETVVCNLASVNIAKVNTPDKIEQIMPLTARILDNVIDLNYYPIKEAEITSLKYRPIGIGFLGLAEYLAVNKLNYDSEEARKKTDELFEEYCYHGLRASVDLAKERGAYPLFEGSEWAKGMFNGKEIHDIFEGISGDELHSDMIKYGTRFGYHFAPAPNTSTAKVIGTTASVLPIYKKTFTETDSIGPFMQVAPGLCPENMWHYKEYVNIDTNEVIDMITVIYKWIDQSSSFEWVIDPAKTSPGDLYGYYMKAWKQGIKTTYYIRSLSLEAKDDCSSCSG